jgi:hypothetical protein
MQPLKEDLMAESPNNQTAVWKIVIAWLIVLAPFGWGIYYTVRSSLAIFRH